MIISPVNIRNSELEKPLRRFAHPAKEMIHHALFIDRMVEGLPNADILEKLMVIIEYQIIRGTPLSPVKFQLAVLCY